jgi:hypothetical protein
MLEWRGCNWLIVVAMFGGVATDERSKVRYEQIWSFAPYAQYYYLRENQGYR